MKKLLATVLTLSMMMGLVGCGSTPPSPNASQPVDVEAQWPTKNVTIIQTMGAGGDTDFNGRLMARMMEKNFDVSFVTNNVTGSNGSVAMNQYKDGDTDGYTFIMTNSSAISGNEATGMVDFGYDSFEPVCVYAKQSGENIIVPADSPYETLDDLIQASAANPNTIKLGISTGGAVYIASVILEQSGAEFAVVESGDASTRMTDLLGGHVDATIVSYLTCKEYIEAGQVKTLGTLLAEAPTLMPDMPVASDTIPDLVFNSMYTCLAPKGTPPEIVEAMNAAILYVVENDEEYAAEVRAMNMQDPWALSVEDTITELQNQRDHFMQFSKYLQ